MLFVGCEKPVDGCVVIPFSSNPSGTQILMVSACLENIDYGEVALGTTYWLVESGIARSWIMIFPSILVSIIPELLITQE